ELEGRAVLRPDDKHPGPGLVLPGAPRAGHLGPGPDGRKTKAGSLGSRPFSFPGDAPRPLQISRNPASSAGSPDSFASASRAAEAEPWAPDSSANIPLKRKSPSRKSTVRRAPGCNSP